MSPATQEILAVRAWEALGTVIDPELDQPVTELGFVAALRVRPLGSTGSYEVHVVLRLPTYFCAPNFAYLMVADAREAVPDIGPAPRGVAKQIRVAREELRPHAHHHEHPGADDEEAREIAAIKERYADVKPHTTAAAVVFAITRVEG